MIKSKIFDIYYARISTNSTSQLSSLGNQYQILLNLKKNNKDINVDNIVTHIGSGSVEFPPSLKRIILEHYDKNTNTNIRLNVITFDRMTRNFKDIDFLVKYVKYIHVINDNKTYDIDIDLKYIVGEITKCIQELSLIKNRCMREKTERQRQREDDDTDYDYEKFINLTKRCESVSNNIKVCGLTNNNLKHLENLIRISQNLDSSEKWNEMFNLMKLLGLNSDNYKSNYEKYINNYKKKNTIYNIQKKDVLEWIQEILKKHKLTNNSIFINQFINSNMKYGRFDNSNFDKESNLCTLIEKNLKIDS
jgi:hypothetical protein